MTPALSEYIALLLFLGVGALFLAGTFFVSRLLAPSKPDPEKLSAYECGEEAEVVGQIQFNSRFFVIALIFVLFEVEILFFFPWTLIVQNPDGSTETNSTWGLLILAEMFLFVGILGVGLVYAFVKGHLDWIKPQTTPADISYKIPMEAYDRLS